MEVKTTWEILEWFENKEYSIKGKEYNNDKHKKWIAVDDILEKINRIYELMKGDDGLEVIALLNLKGELTLNPQKRVMNNG